MQRMTAIISSPQIMAFCRWPLAPHPHMHGNVTRLKKETLFTIGSMQLAAVHHYSVAIKTNTPDLPPYQLKTIAENVPREGNPECEVIHIDRYENVVLNITKQQFEHMGNGRQFRLQFMRVEEINEISANYTDAREGFKLCRFNSNNYLEICINRGRAASLFGLRLGSRNNDIKIFFE